VGARFFSKVSSRLTTNQAAQQRAIELITKSNVDVKEEGAPAWVPDRRFFFPVTLP
jgi:hypothetical protein